MKTIVKFGLAVAGGFAIGAPAGYFFAKSREAQFEVTTEEDQLAYAQEDMAKRGEDKEPVDAKKEIDNLFNKGEDAKEEGAAAKALNTQKIEYWKRYQEGGGKYDRHSQLAEGEEVIYSDPEEVAEPELDPGFREVIEDGGDDDEGEVIENLPGIEESTLQEYYHWCSIADGEYDTISVTYYEPDDTLVDESGDEPEKIENPMRFLGFDPKIMFAKRKPGADDDPDAIYIKNNTFKTVYEVIREKTSYAVKERINNYGSDDE